MIKEEDSCRDKYRSHVNARGDAGQSGQFPREKKKSIDQVEETVMSGEEEGDTDFGLHGLFDRFVIYGESFRGKVFQHQDSDEIKKADDDALRPINPHYLQYRPCLDKRPDYGYQIGKNKRPGGAVLEDVP